MSNYTMPEQPTSSSSGDSLLVALFVAAIVHIALVFGLNFTTLQPARMDKSIDITLVDRPAKKAPEKAKFLAQENQTGAGEKVSKPEPPKKQLPSRSNKQVEQIKKAAPEKTQLKPAPKVIARQKPEKKVVVATKLAVDSQPEKRPLITAEALQQQIAQLGTEIRQNNPGADKTKIKFVDSVSAHKYMAAQYMKDWENKVERMGNLNYPEVATRKNFSGTLTMDVGIKADGSIYSIRINRSSGNPELDEAAKNIVRMSAPFAPLPVDLRKELDVLVITRIWKFSDESGLVTR
ncbi:MAG: energy transducer TonB [Methylococcales bacterium]|nr:energy transducer TonB [Methylococcales bacterium]